MLKIKDRVDLKELEKFGLKKKTKYYSDGYISVSIDSRYLLINNLSYSPYGDFIPNENMYNSQRFFIADKVYDLIKADMVEKGEEL